ncbi:MAG TPA: TMEM175 family protein [Micromonosporaceae bacterium]|jgi:uncharacterized membrane protein|nr:TMEM175 family protein [Micromonosporaceae bacterium]
MDSLGAESSDDRDALTSSERARRPEARTRGIDRLLTFSDGVVAIAATLLILPLVDAAVSIGHRTVGALIDDERHALFAFVLSFAVICNFWFIHHQVYEHVIAYTPALVVANCLWLLCIVFLPFPTELIGGSNRQGRIGDGLYVGTMLVATIANMLASWIIARSPELREQSAPRASINRAVYATCAMALAFVIAVTLPRIGLWGLLLLLAPSERIDGYVRDRWHRWHG